MDSLVRRALNYGPIMMMISVQGQLHVRRSIRVPVDMCKSSNVKLLLQLMILTP